MIGLLSALCLRRHEIIFGQYQTTRRETSWSWARGRRCCPVGYHSSPLHEVKGHTALWEVGSLQLAEQRRCKAAAGRAWSSVNTRGEEARRRQFCHVQRAGATLAGDGDVSSWPAGKGESYREDWAESIQRPATKTTPDVKINYRGYP